ncbi:cytochrome P450, partial [Mycolicibacterium elephantis]
NPSRLDIDRPNLRRQLSFGHGLHFCLGSSLARLEVTAMLNAVLDRYQRIELSDDPGTKQTASLLTHAYVRLPLRLS